MSHHTSPSLASRGAPGSASWRFAAPPGWPPPPPGWRPPHGWAPDPTWPPAPPGWVFWVPANRPPQPARDPYATGPQLEPPTEVVQGAYQVDNAPAWAIVLTPFVVWLLLLPVRLTWNVTPHTYLVLFAVLITALYAAFYLMDRAALRQAKVDTTAWGSLFWLGAPAYLVQRCRFAGQTWAMPVLWVVGFLVAVLL